MTSALRASRGRGNSTTGTDPDTPDRGDGPCLSDGVKSCSFSGSLSSAGQAPEPGRTDIHLVFKGFSNVSTPTRTIGIIALAHIVIGCASSAQAGEPSPQSRKVPLGKPVIVNDRMVEIAGGVSFEGMKKAQKQVLDYAAQGDDPIWLRINSPGGSVDAGLILVDTMKAIKAPIHCVVESSAYSMAAIILTYCEKRYAMPHATIMLHEASYGMTGEDPSIRSRHDFLTRYLDRMHVEIARNIGMDLKKYRERIRDAWWLMADEAKAANIVEEVVTHLEYVETPLTKTEEKKTVTWTSDKADRGAQTIPKRRD